MITREVDGREVDRMEEDKRWPNIKNSQKRSGLKMTDWTQVVKKPLTWRKGAKPRLETRDGQSERAVWEHFKRGRNWAEEEDTPASGGIFWGSISETTAKRPGRPCIRNMKAKVSDKKIKSRKLRQQIKQKQLRTRTRNQKQGHSRRADPRQKPSPAAPEPLRAPLRGQVQ